MSPKRYILAFLDYELTGYKRLLTSWEPYVYHNLSPAHREAIRLTKVKVGVLEELIAKANHANLDELGMLAENYTGE
jgi:hypothetical protein